MAASSSTITVEMPVHLRLSRKSAIVQYADELGVTTLFEDSKKTLDSLNRESMYLANLEQELRDIRASVFDREVDIAARVHSDHPAESGAERERIIKRMLTTDATYLDRKKKEREYLDKQTDATVKVDVLKREHRALVAQMNVLGSYLSVLSATKDGQNIERLLSANNNIL